ncbi:sulfatase-like hydrolase/transferase [Saccharicrinis aurantiacus]|uniref:sulfatase-like hydrolase/transferase n=1 Tax=Saccharicrinis aurantiacus TaxID=1849719 RepID=UPI00094FDA84|nr:sulfatase-like hydrolase/transferase [Saccharicrinis aurantiacus]
MKNLYLLALVLLFSACNNPKETVTKQKPKTDKPNIIILLTDDLGYGELTSYGQEVIKTPYMDQLAAGGMRFTDFYAGTSVCSPSRAVLMTGMHTGHVNIRGNKGDTEGGKWDRIALKKSEITIAEMLKVAGYQTAMIGKWHLGVPEDISTWAHGRGFDYAVQEQWGKGADGRMIDERMHWINGQQDSLFYDYNEHSCLDDFRTNFALDYLDNKEEDKPFFMYMSYRIPHAHEFFLSETDLYKEHQQEWPEIERRHAARITMLDGLIEKLMKKLEAKGELENTLIFFTSDNGPQNENHHDYHFFNSSGGLKGHKRDVYEGGVRIPAIAYWKGTIKPSVSNHMAAFYDLMPTLAEVAGIEAPEQTDGLSFLPLLTGKEQAKHEFLYWEIQEGRSVKGFRQAVRMDDWKVVRYGDNYKTELYNMKGDIYEENDVASQHPDIVAKGEEILKRESVKNAHWPYSGGVWK